MATHNLTTAEARRGGWRRAAQHAAARRSNPTASEAIVREALHWLSLPFKAEKRIEHPNGQPQWIDALARVPGLGWLAIEVDGSNGWHQHGKMIDYDGMKVELCARLGWPVLVVPRRVSRGGVTITAAFIRDRIEKIKVARRNGRG